MLEDMINTVICGDALTVLRRFPADLIDCVITSPPYWGLRSYKTEPQIWGGDPACEHEWGKKVIKPGITGGINSISMKTASQPELPETSSQFCSLCSAWRGELGLEPTFQLYLDHLLSIFAEVKRVLKPTGTCWVNLGDSYAGGGSHHGDKNLGLNQGKKRFGEERANHPENIPPKSLCGIPERFAIRMTDELGMIRRNTIIWHKLSAMPSSASDRFTVDFEYVYFFTKEPKYYFKQQLEPATGYDGRKDTLYKGGPKDMASGEHERWQYKNLQEMHVKRLEGKEYLSPVRNKRCVWTINPIPSSENHFAQFPNTLVSPMLNAGCPPGGIVLDPFSGMCTVAKVAIKQDKQFVMIELSEEYALKSEKYLNELLAQTKLNF